jgi:UDP-glucose 4-epimerase
LPQSIDRLRGLLDSDVVLIHLARTRRKKDRFDSFSDDIAMAEIVARAVANQSVKKCIYISSTAVYGDDVTNMSITEDTPVSPITPYAIAKYTGERLLAYAARQSGTPMVVLRPCMVYGPGDTSKAYGPARFIDSIVRDGEVDILGDGSEVRDYIFIGDIVQIMARFVENDSTGTFNVASGKSYSFRELIAILKKVSQRDFKMVSLERDRPKTHQCVIISKLLGGMPDIRFTDLEPGLKEAYQHGLAKLLPRG